jgi:quercetin dioxygenase-like cupin family protein
MGVVTEATGGAESVFTLKRIDQLASIHQGAVKLAADELGVKSFGLQVLDFPAGFADYPEHDHALDGQEEVYVVLDGSAEFEVAGEHASLEAGGMLKVDADAKRKLVPGPYGVRILAIGCAPGGNYERPDDFRLPVRA